MSYQVRLAPSARKEIRDLPASVRSQALDLIAELGENPRPPRAKKLRDQENIYRIWLAGRWRIVYAVDEDVVTVLILRVRRKQDIDYPSL